MSLLTNVLVVLVGIVAGFLGAVIGGGGLISIAMLIFLGLPPQSAIATNKLGSIGYSISAIYQFRKKRKIVWKYVLPFSLLSIAGAIVGAYGLLMVDVDLLKKLVGIFLICLLPFIFLKNGLGEKRTTITRKKGMVGFILYFLVMVYGGFFGGGAGLLLIYLLIFCFGLEILEANGTDLIPWLLQSIISLAIFAMNGLVNFYVGIFLFIGMMVGSYLGSHVAIKKGNRWVKIIFTIVVIVSSLKLLFSFI